MPLNERQRLFVAEYLVDLNATQAAIRAGYSTRTARHQGSRLLAHEDIQAAVQAASAQRAQRVTEQVAKVEVKADDVLREYLALAFNDLRAVFIQVPGGLRVRPLNEWPESIGHSLSSVKVKQTLEKKPGKANNDPDAFEQMEVIEFRLHSKTEALKVLAEIAKLAGEKPGTKENPLVVKGEIKHDVAADLAPYAAAIQQLLTGQLGHAPAVPDDRAAQPLDSSSAPPSPGRVPPQSST